MYTTFTNDTATFVMEGSEQVLSLRARVKVDKSTIKSIKWLSKFNDWPSLQIRMPGSYLPSWIMAGSYWSDDGWDFVLAKKPKGLMRPILFDVMVIETTENRYRRVIIRTTKEKVDEVLSWWREQ